MVPLFLAAVGLILRGTAYALHGAANGPDDRREIDAVFGLSSVFTPFALGAAVGAIASGRVPVGAAATSGAAGSTRPRSWSACSRWCWARTWPRC